MKALNKYTIFGLLFLIAAIGMVKADFTSGEFSLKADCFEAVFQNYEFRNNTTETQTYKLTATGEGAEWVNVNGKWISTDPLMFELGAGKSKTLYAYFKPCCWTKPGKYIIGLKYSSSGESGTEKVTLTVLESRKILLEVVPETLRIGQCQEGLFSIRVQNNSHIGETIQLNITGLNEEWLNLSANEFYIESGAEREAQLQVLPACTEELGEYNGKVIARIKNTELSTSKDLEIEIVDKQFIELGTGVQRNAEACNDLDQEHKISVSNLGRAKDTIELSIDGPNWIELKEKSLVLNAGEVKDLTVEFNSADSEEKEYTFTIKAKSKTFGKETTETFRVTVLDCFKLGVEKVAGAEEVCIENAHEYTFLVKNLKDTSTKVSISATGIENSISQGEFDLASGQEKEIKVLFDFDKAKAGDNVIELIVEGDNFEFSKKFGLKLNDCYAIKLDHEELCEKTTVVTGASICPKERIITSTVKNTGTKENTVSLELTGINWIYLEPKDFTLAPGEEAEFYTYFSPGVNEHEGDYTGELVVKARDFQEKAVIRVEVDNVGSGEEIDITAETEIEEEIIEKEKTVKSKIHLRNTGNCLLIIKDITASGFETDFDPSYFELDVNEETTITATIHLGKETEAKEISLPIRIETDRGIIKKTLTVSFTEKTAVVEEVTKEQLEPNETTEPATKVVTTKVTLRNSQSEALAVLAITAEDYNIIFEPNAFEIDTNEKREITAMLTVDWNAEGEIIVPITIETTKGTIEKEIKFTAEKEAISAIPAGFAGLGSTTVNMVILLFLAIVAVVIVILAWHAYKKPTTQKKKKK